MERKETILILDFGGQYTQLIARRVRECHVYSEVVPWNLPLRDILAREPKGIILSGGPSSVRDADAPRIDPALYDAGIPRTFWAARLKRPGSGNTAGSRCA